MEPAVDDRLGGGLRPVPVSGDDIGSPDPQLPELAGRQRLPGRGVDDVDIADRHRSADAVGLLDVVLPAVRGGERGGLGEAVPVARSRLREELGGPADERGSGRRSPGADPGQAAEVAVGEVRVLVELGEHRRHAGEARHPFALHELESDPGVPLVHEHEGGSLAHRAEQHRMAAGGMEERHRDEDRPRGRRVRQELAQTAPLPQLLPGRGVPHAHDVAADVSVRAEGPLGGAGGAGGVEDRRAVVRTDLAVRQLRGAGDLGHVPRAGGQLSGGTGHEHGEVEGGQHIGEALEALVVREQHARSGIAQPELELTGGPPGVERYDDGACAGCGEEGDRPFRVVAHRDGDSVPRADPVLLDERVREPGHTAEVLGVAQAVGAEHEHVPVPVLA